MTSYNDFPTKGRELRNWIGERVEIPVHYDLWMQGARFGVVTSFAWGGPGKSDYLRVRLDKVPHKRLKVWRGDIEYMKRV